MKRIVNALGKFNWEKRAYALFLLCATTAIALHAQTSTSAQTFATLHSFDFTDGSQPYAGLVQATDGNLYGTTPYGGAKFAGTVFKTTPSGTLTTLHSFDGKDGYAPYAAPVQATDGNFYGTTPFGGATNGGTVFKITPSGTLTTLYSFCSQSGCTDGQHPFAGLVQTTDGNLYGTTLNGGADEAACFDGCGTLFKITPSGTLTTLYSFCSQSDCRDGNYPDAGLIQGSDGDLYGTTLEGADGLGTVFKITPSGRLTTLYRFCSQHDCIDGAYPQAALVQATDGSFYGITLEGGANGYGTVFKIAPCGTLTTLYSFCSLSGCTDGEYPYDRLVQATDGNFYGTASGGGADGYGTVFRITRNGGLTTLYSFCPETGCAEGEVPYAALLQDTNGMFYGTTSRGGANSDGTVFSLSVGLGPFVETQTTSGKAGSVVKILGTHLTGATKVMFNGTAAVFKVVSSSLITTTVPRDATSGKVRVTTPHGTLSSNVPFRVRP